MAADDLNEIRVQQFVDQTSTTPSTAHHLPTDPGLLAFRLRTDITTLEADILDNPAALEVAIEHLAFDPYTQANDIRLQRTTSPPNYTEYNQPAQITASAASSPLIIESRTPSPTSPAYDRRSPPNAQDITTFATLIDRTPAPAPTGETYDNEILHGPTQCP